MKYKLLFILSGLLLASCSNYNKLNFIRVEKLNQELFEGNFTFPELYKIAMDDIGSPPDTIYFKDRRIVACKMRSVGDKYFDWMEINSEEVLSTRLDEIDSIKYHFGFVWPRLDNECDTIIFKNGKSKELRLKTMLSKVADFEDCQTLKHVRINKNKLKSVELSNGNRWLARGDFHDKERASSNRKYKRTFITSYLVLPVPILLTFFAFNNVQLASSALIAFFGILGSAALLLVGTLFLIMFLRTR